MRAVTRYESKYGGLFVTAKEAVDHEKQVELSKLTAYVDFHALKEHWVAIKEIMEDVADSSDTI